MVSILLCISFPSDIDALCFDILGNLEVILCENIPHQFHSFFDITFHCCACFWHYTDVLPFCFQDWYTLNRNVIILYIKQKYLFLPWHNLPLYTFLFFSFFKSILLNFNCCIRSYPVWNGGGGSYVPHSLTFIFFISMSNNGVPIYKIWCFGISIQHTNNIIRVPKI